MLKTLITNKGIVPGYNKLSLDGVQTIMGLQGFVDAKDITKVMYDGLLEEKDPLTMALEYKIVNFDMRDMVDTGALILLNAYSPDRVGKVVLYLILLLDFFDQHDRPATIKDVVETILPDGFYNDETCKLIINDILKPGLYKYSHVYNN